MSLHDRTLALAGVFQAALLVKQLAHEGRADSDLFGASINSILMVEAGDTAEIFGGASGVHAGLDLIRHKLGGTKQPLDVEIARYVVSMLHLAKRLHGNAHTQNAIRQGIETAERQMKFFDPDESTVHPSLIEKLAELYVRTLSTLAPRVIVTGEHGFLVNPAIAARVRAALLAGVRAGFLWRQLGGRRWHLLIARRGMVAEARRLLDTGHKH